MNLHDTSQNWIYAPHFHHLNGLSDGNTPLTQLIHTISRCLSIGVGVHRRVRLHQLPPFQRNSAHQSSIEAAHHEPAGPGGAHPFWAKAHIHRVIVPHHLFAFPQDLRRKNTISNNITGASQTWWHIRMGIWCSYMLEQKLCDGSCSIFKLQGFGGHRMWNDSSFAAFSWLVSHQRTSAGCPSSEQRQPGRKGICAVCRQVLDLRVMF